MTSSRSAPIYVSKNLSHTPCKRTRTDIPAVLIAIIPQGSDNQFEVEIYANEIMRFFSFCILNIMKMNNSGYMVNGKDLNYFLRSSKPILSESSIKTATVVDPRIENKHLGT